MRNSIIGLVLGLVFLSGFSMPERASAQQFDFAVVGVQPSSYVTKMVVIDVSSMPYNTAGWSSFNLMIDGQYYPITNWNSVAYTPFFGRAWFNVPSCVGWHRLQLVVSYQQFGWIYPAVFYSMPKMYLF